MAWKKKAEKDSAAKPKGFAFEVIKAAVLALLISLVLVLIAALIISFVDIGNLAASIINQVIKGIAILSACVLSFKDRNNGWLKGLCAAFLFIILYIVVYSLIVSDFAFGLSVFIDICTGLGMGLVSGIIAVNVRK